MRPSLAITKAAQLQLVAELKEMADKEQGPLKELWREGHKVEAERGVKTEEYEAEVQAIKEVMIEYGLNGDDKPKRSGEIARKPEEQRFRPLFKICSKIMHRTTVLIAATNDPSGLDPIVPFFARTGFSDLLYHLSNLRHEQPK